MNSTPSLTSTAPKGGRLHPSVHGHQVLTKQESQRIHFAMKDHPLRLGWRSHPSRSSRPTTAIPPRVTPAGGATSISCPSRCWARSGLSALPWSILTYSSHGTKRLFGSWNGQGNLLDGALGTISCVRPYHTTVPQRWSQGNAGTIADGREPPPGRTRA